MMIFARCCINQLSLYAVVTLTSCLFDQLLLWPIVISTSCCFDQLSLQSFVALTSCQFDQLSIWPVVNLTRCWFHQLVLWPVVDLTSCCFGQLSLWPVVTLISSHHTDKDYFSPFSLYHASGSIPKLATAFELANCDFCFLTKQFAPVKEWSGNFARQTVRNNHQPSASYSQREIVRMCCSEVGLLNIQLGLNLVTPKVRAKRELLFNEPATDLPKRREKVQKKF